MIQSVDPEENTVQRAYDDNHNVIEVRETDHAQVVDVADERFVTTFFYDSLNRLEQQVDNIGQTTSYRYDSRDNLVATADASGPLNGATIDRRVFAGGPLTVNAINDFGNVTRYFYDGISRRTREETILTESGAGVGNRVGASLEGIKDDPAVPESATPVADLAQGGGDGIIRTGFSYDNNSLLSAQIDDNGNVTLYLYDNLNRRVTETKGLIVATAPLNKNTILGSREIVTPTMVTLDDPTFIPAGLIDDQLAATRSRLDIIAPLFPSAADRIDDAPPTTTVFGYNAEGNLLIIEDENDNETFTRYDALNRSIAVRVFRSGQADTHIGDPIFAPNPTSDAANPTDVTNPPIVVGTTVQNYEYDGLSRVTRSFDNNDPGTADDNSPITRAYDSLSRVIEESQQIGALPPKIVTSAWRAEDLRSNLIYPNARSVTYAYDGLDRLAIVADQGAPLPIADYDYIGGAERVLVRSFPLNGTRMTRLDDSGTQNVGYDGLRRVVQTRDIRADNSLIVGFSHTYDRTDNKLDEGKLHDAVNSEAYTYDSAYRLVDFTRSDFAAIDPLHSRFTLDGVGNWQQVDGESREHSSINEITSRDVGGTVISLGYDDNGNLTDDGELLYMWDSLNRLRQVSRKADGETISSYAYDTQNRRIRKAVTNSGALDDLTDYYYDGWQVLEEREGADAVTQQYVYGLYIDEPLVLDRNLDGGASTTDAGDQRLFYHQNTQSSVHALTDDTGVIVEGYQYDAYGWQTVFAPGGNGAVDFGGDDLVIVDGASQVANPYLYTGRRLDNESNLLLYRTRYFNSELGRFMSRDTIGVWGDSANFGNGYAYVGSNPINRVDPTGEHEFESNNPNQPGRIHFRINEPDALPSLSGDQGPFTPHFWNYDPFHANVYFGYVPKSDPSVYVEWPIYRVVESHYPFPLLEGRDLADDLLRLSGDQGEFTYAALEAMAATDAKGKYIRTKYRHFMIYDSVDCRPKISSWRIIEIKVPRAYPPYEVWTYELLIPLE